MPMPAERTGGATVVGNSVLALGHGGRRTCAAHALVDLSGGGPAVLNETVSNAKGCCGTGWTRAVGEWP